MKHLFLIFLIIVVFTSLLFFASSYVRSAEMPSTLKTFWKYQCIDTMKYSRDAARSLIKDPKMKQIIDTQLSAIKGMGANCVAIDTPYDEEFVPYLTAWVKTAREKDLHVWFRGNFAEWEGWFDYKPFSNITEHHKKTLAFITTHSDLFVDGDIFTPAPEAENGSNGDPRGSDEKIQAFNQFIRDSHDNCIKAFASIHKRIECGYVSHNGDIAKDVLTQQTVNTLGGNVTIDHYVKSPDEMAQYIDAIHNKFHASVILGEFGAPIPDLNGDLSPQGQATFVDSLFRELYKHRDVVPAVNYWVLNASSTELLNDDNSPRPVVSTIKKYYIPATITGKVLNTAGEAVQNAEVQTSDQLAHAKTDGNGNFRLLVPAEDTLLEVHATNYFDNGQKITITEGKEYTSTISLTPYTSGFFYWLQVKIKEFFSGTF